MTASHPADIGAESLDTLQRVLQPVADSVRAVAGFEVAAVAVLRPDERFEYIVLSSDAQIGGILGSGNSLSMLMNQTEHAEKWGRFDYLNHERASYAPGEASWVPDVEYPEGADSFHPDDALSTFLRGEDGRIIGLLSLDVPVNGRKPGPEQRILMDAFGTHAERMLRLALTQRDVDERLRLARTARDIVRRASSSVTIEAVISQARPALMEGFSLQGLWIQYFQGRHGRSVPRVTTASGKRIEVPAWTAEFAERAATASWAEKEVVVVGPNSPPPLLDAEERTRVLDYLAELGVGSMLFAPMGAGDLALGTLVFTREDPHQEWTPAECATAQELGVDLGQALLNAQLFEEHNELVEELQELHEHKQMLVDMMVHELKNPLTSISGHLELVQGEPGLSPEVTAWLGAIERGTGRLQQLVDNLLTFSKVQEREEARAFGPADLQPLVARNVEMLQVKANVDQLDISWAAPSPATVWGDADMLELVVSNLVSNAVKYTPEGGKIRVTVHQEDDVMVLCVTDSGLGISLDDQSRIFDEFYRSTNPVATVQPGTGLGLSIVADVVKQHGGTISVRSVLGQGSTFEVRLPTKPSEQ